jgi:asparagine synthase (glutamine-hydrolysing)
MCGIAGFVDETVDSASGALRLDEMLQQIVHRGPDDAGVLAAPHAGLYLGMRRLSVIDVAGGQQPVWNEDGTIAVVFNGEIYNYIELREALRRKGHVFRTNSDTETLVHLYEEHGPDLVLRLRGMFAFCLYDAPRRRLLIARDHFGQKPLYYCSTGRRFGFASEIKALLELPFVPDEIDAGAYLDYVSWHRLPAPQTHFRAIRKLPAGHLLEIDLQRPDCVEPRRYWSPQFDGRCDLNDMNSAAAALDEALSESTRLHLRSDVPVGIMLTGPPPISHSPRERTVVRNSG